MKDKKMKNFGGGGGLDCAEFCKRSTLWLRDTQAHSMTNMIDGQME